MNVDKRYTDLLDYLVQPKGHDHSGDKTICYLTFGTEKIQHVKQRLNEGWIDLAKQGKPVTVDNAMSNKINNTEAGEKDRDQFDKLDSSKRDRFVKDLVNNNIELPIIARYSDGYLELVGGNTRLTGMMSQIGQGKAWVFDVPDEVANLAESKQNVYKR